MVFERWRRERVARRVTRQMMAARRRGEGVYMGEWWGEQHPHGPAEPVIEWCREVLAGCRRPRGIDQFDMALACRLPDGRVVTRVFQHVRPADLYTGAFAEDLAALMSGPSRALHVAAALFSWGNAADAALPA